MLFDISAFHRASADKRALGDFFRTRGYKRAYAFLRTNGHAEDAIVVRKSAHRSTPGVALVAPLIAMEYMRWVDYDRFCETLLLQLSPTARAVDACQKVQLMEHEGPLNG